MNIKQHKILLVGVNAKYIHSTPAIYCLKSYADKYYTNRPDNCVLELCEYTINQSSDSIIADLYHRKPSVVAFSCYIWNWKMIQEIIAELNKVLPDTQIWLGGPEVSFHADTLINTLPQLTGVMLGEGEATFMDILKYYWENEGTLNDIKGIVYRDEATTQATYTPARELTDINTLPFIYDTPDAFSNRIIYYESQRGCPFRCAYCLSSIDKKVRLRDIETVKAELKFFLDNNVNQVKFIDRTFNCNAKHANEIWKFLKENDNNVTNFHFEIAADLLTKEQLDIMSDMRPGLIQLEIGVQSTNETTLKAINRHMDIKELKNTVATVRSFNNIHQHLDLIAGLPYEDYDSFVNSFNDVYNMAPNQLQLGFLKVLKGSPMEEMAREYGIVYNSKPPYEVLYTNWLSYDDVLKLKRIEEMVELYYNTAQFSHTITMLEKEFDSPFKLYETLAQYYMDNNYFINTPSRAYRYQVLLEFACSINPDKKALYSELLTYDMYLRENLKSRPVFAPAQNLPKDSTREFYKAEEANPQYLLGYEGYQSTQLSRMTHIESFSYDVWSANTDSFSNKLNTPTYILFDYINRDALTHDAKTFKINL